jgi:hypothetical protein
MRTHSGDFSFIEGTILDVWDRKGRGGVVLSSVLYVVLAVRESGRKLDNCFGTP